MIKHFICSIISVFCWNGNVENTTIIEAVRDFSGDSAKAVNIAKDILNLKVQNTYDDDEYPVLFSKDEPVFNALFISLHDTDNLIALDTKDTLEESVELFTKLFEKNNLDIQTLDSLLESLPQNNEYGGVVRAYSAFRIIAEKQNARIMSVNADGDMYYFIISSKEKASKWTSFPIGDNKYIEDPDWQFYNYLPEFGITPRNANHPSKDQK